MDRPIERGERFGLLIGGLLIAQGSVFAALRFLEVVYVIASEADRSDRARIPLPHFLPWLLISTAVVTVLVWAGARFRRSPASAWRASGAPARVMVILAWLGNGAALVLAARGLARGPSTAEGVIAWSVILLVTAAVLVGITRDFLRSRRTG